jgi:hypothetical protein
VAADWIGSNMAWFAPCLPEHALEAYWPLARAKARQALNATSSPRPVQHCSTLPCAPCSRPPPPFTARWAGAGFHRG